MGAVLLGFLAVIFIGMTTAFLGMTQGEPDKAAVGRRQDQWWQLVPPAVLGLLVLWLGLAVPETLGRVLRQIVSTLGGAS